MSNRLTTVRDALELLVDAARLVIVTNSPASPAGQYFAKAMASAERALTSTAFVAPIAYPAQFETRAGREVVLLARHAALQVGVIWNASAGWVAPSWNLDGSYFDAGDPDADDLVLPEVDPALVGVPA